MSVPAIDPMWASPAILGDELPVLFEDDHEVEMGESNPHFITDDILYNGIKAHLASRLRLVVYSNMNLHYHPKKRKAYKTPDVMVVEPPKPLPLEQASYRIGADGPAPLLVSEILSERTANRGDLKIKVPLYARLGIAEYLIVDPTGDFLPERLLVKRLRPDGAWEDLRDPDGGVTSQLGFRVMFDPDGRLRVINALTGVPYARPDEAEAEAEKRRQAEAARELAEARVRELEARLEQLRQQKRNGRNGGENPGAASGPAGSDQP